ncbi:MAG TPA: dihydroorotate dehydrogenase-like protein [Magnetospirillum sp.]|nr:dihydroorotate dehydrogenase-like protein [Magnetospirillum sp.]
MDLTTRYLGLSLKNPLVASACPLGLDVGNIRKLEDCGAGAIVLPSIFQEDIENEIEEIEHLASLADSEALSYFPSHLTENAGPKNYLNLIRKARAAVDMPVIASLNGTSRTGWIDYAKQIEEAGAHAIELNVFFLPTDLSLSGAEVEARHIDILKAVKQAVSIPVAIKLSPYFSSPGAMVRALDDAGADGFVLFNRFYQPDINLEELTLQRDLRLSHRGEIRLPLLWIAALHGKVKGSLAATSGVQTAAEVVKYLFAGADVVMTASALLRHGVEHMQTLHDGLVADLTAREAESLADIRGRLSRDKVADQTAFDRVNYIRILRGGHYVA